MSLTNLYMTKQAGFSWRAARRTAPIGAMLGAAHGILNPKESQSDSAILRAKERIGTVAKDAVLTGLSAAAIGGLVVGSLREGVIKDMQKSRRRDTFLSMFKKGRK